MKLKNYSIFFLSVMSLSSGGRKGWDFSSYEDCLSFYSNRSFPGQFWNENKSFRDQFWNCLGHSSFIFRFYDRDDKKSYKQLSFRKVWFQKTLSFFPFWDFEDFFWKKVAQMYSHVFERRRKIDLRIQAGTLCGGWKKISYICLYASIRETITWSNFTWHFQLIKIF